MIPEPADQVVPDLQHRGFTADAPNTVHVGDIAYLPCSGGQQLPDRGHEHDDQAHRANPSRPSAPGA
jgi:hypothetical protein